MLDDLRRAEFRLLPGIFAPIVDKHLAESLRFE
jgi:hypothetical protein